MNSVQHVPFGDCKCRRKFSTGKWMPHPWSRSNTRLYNSSTHGGHFTSRSRIAPAIELFLCSMSRLRDTLELLIRHLLPGSSTVRRRATSAAAAEPLRPAAAECATSSARKCKRKPARVRGRRLNRGTTPPACGANAGQLSHPGRTTHFFGRQALVQLEVLVQRHVCRHPVLLHQSAQRRSASAARWASSGWPAAPRRPPMPLDRF